MAEYVVAQAAVLIVPSMKKFKTELERMMKQQQAMADSFKIEARLDSKKALAEYGALKSYLEGQDIRLTATVDTRTLTEIRQKYEDVAREFQKGLFLNLKVAGMSLLPQLAQGLAAVNASMVELTRTAALLPGLLSVAASSISTVVLGIGGVKDAFKEYGDAQKNAAQEGLKARNSAINVQNAYRDLGRSIKDAKRNLEDLNAELRDAPLDEAEAIIRVAEAQQEAADKAGKSGLQQQKDIISLRKAENDLVDTRLRNSRLVQDAAEANAKGVQGADSVTEATERLSKAQDEANTQATKLSDSLKELSPNAQAFVQALTGMSGQWTAFRNSVQDRLFAGLDTEVTQLYQTSLPMLQKGLGGIADALNGNVKAAIDELQQPSNQGFLEKIFGNTAVAQRNLSGVFDPLLDSFLRLSAVGSSFMPRLVDGLGDLLTRFDDFVIRAEGDGSLDKWINDGIDEFKALGNSIINVGSILNSITEAFTGSGGQTFLEWIENATSKLSLMLKSDEGQERLKRFFIEAREELAKWKPIFDQLPNLLGNLASAGQAWADLLLPFLRTAATLLGEHPGLVQTVFAAYMLWNGIVPIVKGIGKALELTNTAVGYFGRDVDKTGKKIAGTSGFKGDVDKVSGALMGTGGLLFAATTVATYLTTELLNAHAEAGAAAARQKRDLDELTTSLDNVTGAATRATSAMIADNILEGNNAKTNQTYGDLTGSIKNGTPEQFNKNIVAGNVDAALAMVPGAATAKDIEATDWWKQNSGNLERAGLNSSVVANALNGEPDAKKKFDEWQLRAMRETAPVPGLSDAALRVLEKVNPLSSTPDLADLQGQLPADMQKATALRQEVYAGVNDIQQGRTATQNRNAFFGRYQLKPGSPFSALGVIDQPAVNENNGGLTTRSKPADGSALEQEFQQNGVTFADNGNGAYNVNLSLSAVEKYLQKYAMGGKVTGPGSGTSDSIMARLSNGEYVVNAASTKKHLPLLESINGGKLPGFSMGGMVFPRDPVFDGGDPSADPGLPAVGSAIAGAFGALTGPGAFVGSPAAPTPRDIPYFDENSVLQGNTQYSPSGLTPTPDTAAAMVDKGVGAGFDAGTAIGTVPVPVAPTPVAPPSVPADGTIPTSPDSRVNPSTTVHGGSKPSAGPGNTVPHQVAGLPARPGPYSLPGVASTAMTSLGAINPAFLSAYEGLPVGSAINYGQGGFPDWVYQIGAQFGMNASTYPGHQEGGGTNKGIDWAPNGVSWNTPEGAQLMTNYAKYLASTGMMEQVIYKNPFTGEMVGIANGKPVGPGTDQPQYYAADWDGHMDHIHTRQSKAIPTPAQLQQLGLLGGSPSNMALAGTPTGLMLPQLTYGNGSGSGADGSGSSGGMRMPTPEEYAKYVSDSWMDTMQNAVQNAGQIAMSFLGSFFGLDLSKITGLGNSLLGGIDLPGMNDKKGGGSDSGSQLGAIPEVDAIMQAAGQLPPEYQQAYVDAAMANPSQAGALLQQVMGLAGGSSSSGSVGPVQYDPSKGAEQWRSTVRAIVEKVAPEYGITNLKAWEDALVRQIKTESNGNPGAENLNDTDGKGGTQAVFGIGQFLPSTFAAHNRTGGDISDPVAQIYAMIDYVATKYGMDSSGAPNQIGRGVGYASGGMVKGMGSGKSDSMIARVSNGEYVVKAAQARKHMGLLDAINGGRMPGFAEGGPIINPMFPPPPPPPIPPVTTPPPPPAPVPPDPGGPAADMNAGMPTAPAPAVPAVDQAQADLQEAGATVGGIGEAVSGVVDGASAPAGGNPEGDPRSALMAAPQTMEHNKPAIQQGITQAAGAIAGAVSTAISAAGAGVGGPAGGAAGGAASAPISGLITAGGTAVAGAVNILSSLGVGTLTPSTTTAGAYGAPMLPETKGQQPYSGPGVVNNWNGGVHTTNNEEFFKVQQRKELQNASPYLPQR